MQSAIYIYIRLYYLVFLFELQHIYLEVESEWLAQLEMVGRVNIIETNMSEE